MYRLIIQRSILSFFMYLSNNQNKAKWNNIYKETLKLDLFARTLWSVKYYKMPEDSQIWIILCWKRFNLFNYIAINCWLPRMFSAFHYRQKYNADLWVYLSKDDYKLDLLIEEHKLLNTNYFVSHFKIKKWVIFHLSVA